MKDYEQIGISLSRLALNPGNRSITQEIRKSSGMAKVKSIFFAQKNSERTVKFIGINPVRA